MKINSYFLIYLSISSIILNSCQKDDELVDQKPIISLQNTLFEAHRGEAVSLEFIVSTFSGIKSLKINGGDINFDTQSNRQVINHQIEIPFTMADGEYEYKILLIDKENRQAESIFKIQIIPNDIPSITLQSEKIINAYLDSTYTIKIMVSALEGLQKVIVEEDGVLLTDTVKSASIDFDYFVAPNKISKDTVYLSFKAIDNLGHESRKETVKLAIKLLDGEFSVEARRIDGRIDFDVPTDAYLVSFIDSVKLRSDNSFSIYITKSGTNQPIFLSNGQGELISVGISDEQYQVSATSTSMYLVSLFQWLDIISLEKKTLVNEISTWSEFTKLVKTIEQLPVGKTPLEDNEVLQSLAAIEERAFNPPTGGRIDKSLESIITLKNESNRLTVSNDGSISHYYSCGIYQDGKLIGEPKVLNGNKWEVPSIAKLQNLVTGDLSGLIITKGDPISFELSGGNYELVLQSGKIYSAGDPLWNQALTINLRAILDPLANTVIGGVGEIDELECASAISDFLYNRVFGEFNTEGLTAEKFTLINHIKDGLDYIIEANLFDCFPQSKTKFLDLVLKSVSRVNLFADSFFFGKILGDWVYYEGEFRQCIVVNSNDIFECDANLQIAKASGDNQIGQNGVALTNPFVIKVTDKSNQAVEGISVEWTVTQGNGKILTKDDATNATGQAQATFEMGTTPEANKIEARVNLIGEPILGSPAVFTASIQATLPVVSTTPITNITENAARSGGNITSDGNASITARGIVWSTSVSPTIALPTKTQEGTGAGSFPSQMTGLAPNTTYFVRAYATNVVGTSYGEELSLRTVGSLPIITTSQISNITFYSATSGVTISNDGGLSIISKGVVWNTSGSPTVELTSKTNDGSGLGFVQSQITGLVPGTIYFVRAYATNSIGTSYGNQVVFKTLGSLPNVETGQINAIKTTSAMSGVTIRNDGGLPIISKGIVWSTSVSPTILLSSKTNDGSGSGYVQSQMSELIPGTTYFVRAYATNGGGTGYGNELSFTTFEECLDDNEIVGYWDFYLYQCGTSNPPISFELYYSEDHKITGFTGSVWGSHTWSTNCPDLVYSDFGTGFEGKLADNIITGTRGTTECWELRKKE